MENVILVIHLLLAVSLIGLILLQRSEGGGLGIGGGGGMGSLATAGQTANALTRATAICAACFFTTSIVLAILAGTHHKQGSVLDSLDAPAPVSAPAPAANDNPAKPEEAEKPADSKPSSTPSNEHGDESGAKLDSAAPSGDKEVPKATDKPEPQTGAPSAPISE